MGFLSSLFTGRAAKPDLPQMIRDGALVIDARTPQEFSGGYIEGAINIPHQIISQTINDYTTDKTRSIVVYCHSGARSAMAVGALRKAGFEHVENGGSMRVLSQQLGV